MASKSKYSISSKKNKVATSEVGAPTTYKYGGGSGSKGRKNMKPEPIVDKR